MLAVLTFLHPQRPRRFVRLVGARFLHVERVYVPDSRWPDWQVIIGIEVHAQLKSRRKLFSDALTPNPRDPPNTHVSPFDASFPGTLPRLNMRCVDLGLRTALALDSEVQLRSTFDRKHYFYPDLPAGYQITQHYEPIALGGNLKLSTHNTIVRIKQIQLEQDTAKSTFDPRQGASSIDLNRAGVGLMEIVSHPDIRSPEEAGEYVKTLQNLLRAVGSSDGNMEQGSLRCDVNVSVNKQGDPPGTRCEIKNLNSIKFMMIAIISELHRQTALLSRGEAVAQETRGFDESKAQTFKLRSKEDAPDYRYMPDPNLPPLLLTPEYISHLRETLPPLPSAIREKLLARGLSSRDVDVLTSIDAGDQVPYDGEPSTTGALAYFDAVAVGGRDPKVVANWMTHELLGSLSACDRPFTDNSVTPAQFGELIDMVDKRILTGTSAKRILRHMIQTRSTDSPTTLARDMDLLHNPRPESSSPSHLRDLCEAAISELPAESAVVRKTGSDAPVLNKLVGAVMRKSRGKADATAAKMMLIEVLLGGRGQAR